MGERRRKFPFSLYRHINVTAETVRSWQNWIHFSLPSSCQYSHAYHPLLQTIEQKKHSQIEIEATGHVLLNCYSPLVSTGGKYKLILWYPWPWASMSFCTRQSATTQSAVPISKCHIFWNCPVSDMRSSVQAFFSFHFCLCWRYHHCSRILRAWGSKLARALSRSPPSGRTDAELQGVWWIPNEWQPSVYQEWGRDAADDGPIPALQLIVRPGHLSKGSSLEDPFG